MMRILLTSLLAFAFVFSACQTPEQKKEKEKKEELKKKKETDLRESEDVDFQAFVGRLRKAVANRDVETLKSMMTENFGYKFEPPLQGIEPNANGPGAFQYWEQENLWPELEGILSEKFVKYKGYMVAPPQFAD